MSLTSLHGMEMGIHIFSYHWLLTQFPFCGGNGFLQDNGEKGWKGNSIQVCFVPSSSDLHYLVCCNCSPGL